jgi:large subunit ribosomal protein L28
MSIRADEQPSRSLAVRSCRYGEIMAQVCEVCGKGPQFGNNISHAHNVTRRRWNVNLRPVRAKVPGGSRRMRVCASCLRSGKVTKA